MSSSRIVRRLTGHTDWALAAEFSPDGRVVVTTASDKTARVYDIETGVTRYVLRSLGGDIVYDAHFAASGRWVMVGGGHCASLWDLATDRIVETFSVPDYNSVHLSSDGRRLVALASGGYVYQWAIVHLRVSADEVVPWVEAFTGMRLNEANQVLPLSVEDWEAVRGRLGRDGVEAGLSHPSGG